MAAYNDDYMYNSNSRHPQPAYDDRFQRYDESPAAVPDPYSSPFSDRKYPYSHTTPSQSYGGGGSSSRMYQESDPFKDENAIPMSGRKQGSSAAVDPMFEEQVNDPFVRDARPEKKKKKGWCKRPVPWVCWIMTTIQVIVFIAELIKMGILTKTPIEIHPSFNPMIGPSPYVLINMGSRYPACMHTIPNVQNSTQPISWPCPSATSLSGDDVDCTLSELCGFSGVPNPKVGGSIDEKPYPNQWFRFIIPIFIHAGIIHIGFNMLLQLTLGVDIERLIGSVRFLLVYLASGIFGFVLGGNFAATGIASCGCSGSLFGILALTLLDLLYTWKDRKGPIKDLLFIVADVIIAFILGLLPGLDNFSHIGGFAMGLVLGICILKSPSAFTRNNSVTADDPFAAPRPARYSGISPSAPSSSNGIAAFVKSPRTFFDSRRGAWWAWLIIRAAALLLALIAFILLLKNFYQWRHTCHWCRYLSCLPIKVGGSNWCDVGDLSFTSKNNTSTS